MKELSLTLRQEIENRQTIFYVIRRKGLITRPNLKDYVPLSLPTINRITEDMITVGMIRENGVDYLTRGRSAALLDVNPDTGRVIGVTAVSDFVIATLMDFNGKILKRTKKITSPFADKKDLIKRIIDNIRELIDDPQGGMKKVCGIGIGIAGLLNREDSLSISFPNLTGWKNVPLRKIVENELGKPVFLEHDVNGCLLGESWFGNSKENNNLVFIYIGEGISMSLMINGELYRGENEVFGELGHTIVEPDGPQCFCGNRGCLEKFASKSAILSSIKKAIANGAESRILKMAGMKIDDINMDMVFKALKERDELVSGVMENIIKQLGTSIANVINLLNPKKVILGGSVVESGGQVFLDSLTSIVGSMTLLKSKKDLTIEISGLGEDAISLGAGSLVIDNLPGLLI